MTDNLSQESIKMEQILKLFIIFILFTLNPDKLFQLAYRVTLGDYSSGTTPEGCHDFIKLDYSQLTFDSCLRNSIDNGTW